MTALNFPDGQSTGDQWTAENGATYLYNATDDVWTVIGGTGGGGGGSNVTVSPTPPSTPAPEGDMWWDSSDDSGSLYIGYDNYWVAATPVVDGVDGEGSGSISYWNRVGTTLLPVEPGDNLNGVGSAEFAGSITAASIDADIDCGTY